MEKNLPQERLKQPLFSRISLRDRANLYEHLSNLIEGGVTLIDAVDSYKSKTENYLLFQVLSQFQLFIQSGDSVSLAMKKLPKYFSKDEVAIIESGEQTGRLNLSFSNLASQLIARDELGVKIRGALMYPLIVFIMLFLAMMVVLLYVIPRLEPLFTNVGMELPAITLSLVNTSHFFQNNWFFIFLLLGTLIFGIRAYSLSPSGKKSLEYIAFQIPAIGAIYKLYTVVTITSVLSLLIGSGVPIIRSLRIAGTSSGNSIGESTMERVAREVESGNKLADSFERANAEYNLFPHELLQLIAAGEKTSTVNVILGKISAQYSRQIDFAISVFIKFIEPIALLIAAVFVLWFAFAIFSAIFKITETVGA